MFISYAYRDKVAVRPVVEALVAEGLMVWLDNPAGMGFSQDYIDKHVFHLEAGRWRAQLEGALNAAMCVLVCCSRNYVSRYEDTSGPKGSIVRQEVSAARTGNMAVVIRLDDVPLDTFPKELADEQVLDLHDTPQRMAEIARGVRQCMTQVSASELRVEKAVSRDNLTPYLVNRSGQEADAKKAILSASNGGVRAVFMKAPRNECPDQFRERLRRHTSAACLGNGQAWNQVFVDWPSTDDPDDFLDTYVTNLASELGGVRPANLATRLAQPRRAPLAVISVMDMSQWRKRQKKLMFAWLRYWKDIGASSREVKVVPILAVDMPPIRPGWKKIPPIRTNGVSASRIWNEVGQVAKRAARDQTCAPLVRLDVLHPILDGDARAWLRKIVPDATNASWKLINTEIDRIFLQAGRKGMSMEDFAEKMEPAIKGVL